jgi:hypothetical protein
MLAQTVGGRQTGDARADDGHSFHARTLK